jgi:hypothetical protein
MYCRVVEWLRWACIRNRIYWTLAHLTTNNYDSITELHTTKTTVTTAHIKFSVFIIRCLVTVSNGGRSPPCGFPNCRWPQLPCSHYSQLQPLNDSSRRKSGKF